MFRYIQWVRLPGADSSQSSSSSIPVVPTVPSVHLQFKVDRAGGFNPPPQSRARCYPWPTGWRARDGDIWSTMKPRADRGANGMNSSVRYNNVRSRRESTADGENRARGYYPTFSGAQQAVVFPMRGQQVQSPSVATAHSPDAVAWTSSESRRHLVA